MLPAQEQRTVLLARDTLVTELRDLAAGVLGHPRTVRDDLLTSSPPHALHAALTDLPLTGEASAGERRLTDALAAPGGPLTRAWQDTARAAVALERYHHQLPALAGPDAWAVARDTAELAAALPHLDADLAAALPADTTAARRALRAPEAHGLLRLAADEIRAHTSDLPDSAAALEVTARPRITPVRSLGDLPEATATLTALLQHRGADLTALEARATLQALTAGVDLTARLLHATSRGDDPAAAAAGHLHAAVPPLRQLLHEPLATLTPPSAGVLHLAQQIRAQLTAASTLADRLHPMQPRRGPRTWSGSLSRSPSGPPRRPRSPARCATACNRPPTAPGCWPPAATPTAAATSTCCGARSPAPPTARTPPWPPPTAAPPPSPPPPAPSRRSPGPTALQTDSGPPPATPHGTPG
ncbi:MAG: hypothetical protein M3P46_03055 [Actinomycetota bacterium]|nr:hypothetical protein [Actinomycetota bacterium]